MKNKKLYFVFSFSLLFLTSCLPVYECNDYVLDGSSSKWISYYHDGDVSKVQFYYFSDSIMAIAKTRSINDVSKLVFQWGEIGRRIYTTTFFYLPIFPDFLFNSPKDKEGDSWASMYMSSKNDSIIIDFRKIRFFANNGKEFFPYVTREQFRFIDSAGYFTWVEPESIYLDSVEIVREYGQIHRKIDKKSFENIKYFKYLHYSVDFNLFSDTIKTLTVIFDSAEVKGKKVYIEPLHLKQRTYRYYDYSMFK